MSEPDPKTAGPAFHLATRTKRADLPEVGKAKPCDKAECPAPDFEMGFGLAGGGYGTYEHCTVCGNIVSKTDENDD